MQVHREIRREGAQRFLPFHKVICRACNYMRGCGVYYIGRAHTYFVADLIAASRNEAGEDACATDGTQVADASVATLPEPDGPLR